MVFLHPAFAHEGLISSIDNIRAHGTEREREREREEEEEEEEEEEIQTYSNRMNSMLRACKQKNNKAHTCIHKDGRK